MLNQKPLGTFLLATLLAAPATLLAATAPSQQEETSKPDGPLSPGDVFTHASSSVVVVLALDGEGTVKAQGSGVIAAPGVVVTNRHVVDGAASVRVQSGKDGRVAKVLDLDPNHDLATLRVRLKPSPARHRLSSALKVGQRVFAIGAPQGLDLTLSEGLVSALRPEAGAFVIQTTAPISPGSSGGGLFDDRGSLIGITSFSAVKGQNLNFALPMEWVQPLVRVALERISNEKTHFSAVKPEPAEGSTRLTLVGDGGPLRYDWSSPDSRSAIVEIRDAEAESLPQDLGIVTPEVESVTLSQTSREGQAVLRLSVRLAGPMRQRVFVEGDNLSLLFETPPGPPAKKAPPTGAGPPPSPAPRPTTDVTVVQVGP